MNPKRSKSILILASAALCGILLVAWTQPWVAITLTDENSLSVLGDVSAGALSALALSGLALCGAIAIAGPVFRIILGVLQAFIGVAAALSSVIALTQPVESAAAAISEASGVSGDAIADQVASLEVSAWPAIALIASIALGALGIVIAVTAKKWPGSARRFEASRLEPVDAARSSVDDWDSLSSGDDPTR